MIATPREFVTDTMSLILHIERRRMGPRAASVFNSAELGRTTIYIPALMFAELLYLSEKQRISLTRDAVVTYVNQFSGYKESPMTQAVIRSAAEITDIPELHDRLIAGTARLLNLDLITNDPIIQASRFVRAIW